MDPYVVIEYRKIKYKSEPDMEGHTEPIWNQNLHIPIYSLDDEFRISVFDEGIIRDECICSTTKRVSYF